MAPNQLNNTKYNLDLAWLRSLVGYHENLALSIHLQQNELTSALLSKGDYYSTQLLNQNPDGTKFNPVSATFVVFDWFFYLLY